MKSLLLSIILAILTCFANVTAQVPTEVRVMNPEPMTLEQYVATKNLLESRLTFTAEVTIYDNGIVVEGASIDPIGSATLIILDFFDATVVEWAQKHGLQIGESPAKHQNIATIGHWYAAATKDSNGTESGSNIEIQHPAFAELDSLILLGMDRWLNGLSPTPPAREDSTVNDLLGRLEFLAPNDTNDAASQEFEMPDIPLGSGERLPLDLDSLQTAPNPANFSADNPPNLAEVQNMFAASSSDENYRAAIFGQTDTLFTCNVNAELYRHSYEKYLTGRISLRNRGVSQLGSEIGAVLSNATIKWWEQNITPDTSKQITPHIAQLHYSVVLFTNNTYTESVSVSGQTKLFEKLDLKLWLSTRRWAIENEISPRPQKQNRSFIKKLRSKLWPF